MVVVIGDKFGEKKMVVMEPDMQHRMPWYDRYEASSGNFLANKDLKYLTLSCYQRRYLDKNVFLRKKLTTVTIFAGFIQAYQKKNILSVCY